MFVLAPKSLYKLNKLIIQLFEITKSGLTCILIAILFLVQIKVNFAAILDLFFQFYSSVTFIPNPLYVTTNTSYYCQNV